MPRDNNVPSQFKRELTMTEDEEMVLVEMGQFFIENGWINEESQDAFDSLIDKICEPSPFDYV
jgi:hypothetical protein|tara:strand:+ start:1063 stop:1251 length:189 start_codon:yes stop_codon:yes gene_type:complete